MTEPKFDFIEQLRIALGIGLIQSGYEDQDPETGTVNALQWHRCPECPTNGPCACSGVPYLSDEIWDAADKFGDRSRAMIAIETKVRQRVAADIRAELVCCNIYDQDKSTDRAGTTHAICFWGEAAARIAEDMATDE